MKLLQLTAGRRKTPAGTLQSTGTSKGYKRSKKWPRSRLGQFSSVPPEQPQGPAFIQHSRPAGIDKLNRVTIGPSARPNQHGRAPLRPAWPKRQQPHRLAPEGDRGGWQQHQPRQCCCLSHAIQEVPGFDTIRTLQCPLHWPPSPVRQCHEGSQKVCQDLRWGNLQGKQQNHQFTLCATAGSWYLFGPHLHLFRLRGSCPTNLTH